MPTVREVLAEVSKGERLALIDLADDPYMDPNGDDVSLAYEYAVVFGGEQETPGCIRLDYEGGCCGFPPDHVLADVTYHLPSAVYGRLTL